MSGRINSTWGGGLTDMVRSRRLLEIIEAEGLIEAAGPKGARLVAGLPSGRATRPGLISNVRGRGLFVACDLPTPRSGTGWSTDLREAGTGDRAALRRAVDPLPPGPVGERG